jgi:hypothetical protein
VQQPLGFIIGNPDKVLKLKKALYGLRQAPRAWNAKLDKELIALGFVRSKLEHAVYKRSSSKSFLIVGVCADDLIISGLSVDDILKFKTEMRRKFSLSDLGLLSYYLGIEVKHGGGPIMLSQSAYALKILENANMKNCNSCDTPMECSVKLSKLKGEDAVDPTAYKSPIGSLRYIVKHETRINLCCWSSKQIHGGAREGALACCQAHSKVPKRNNWVWMHIYKRRRATAYFIGLQ